MGEAFNAKVFRSGNSVALRLPKAMGLQEGEEVRVVPHGDGHLSIWRQSDAAKILDSLYGAFSPGFMAEGRGDIEQGERDWSGPARDSAA